MFAAGLRRASWPDGSCDWLGEVWTPTAQQSRPAATRSDVAQAGGVPRLFVVTNGAAGVPGDRQLDLGQAILHGMARVIKQRMPQYAADGDRFECNVPLSEVDACITNCCTAAAIGTNRKSRFAAKTLCAAIDSRRSRFGGACGHIGRSGVWRRLPSRIAASPACSIKSSFVGFRP